jgi:hypothetical protein
MLVSVCAATSILPPLFAQGKSKAPTDERARKSNEKTGECLKEHQTGPFEEFAKADP